MKIIALLGTTSSSKSAVAVELAKLLNTQIINFDTYQMYQEFNIGVGKIKEEEQQGVKHHFLSFLKPDQEYSIYQFQKDCRQLLKQKELVIMTGGSNLYLNAVIYDYLFLDPQSDAVCYDLNQDLYQLLSKVDPSSAKAIHPNNIKRIKRALDNYYQTGKVLPRNTYRKDQPLYDVVFIMLKAEREILYKRATERFEKMIEEGLIEEVRVLKEKYGTDSISFQAIGYLQIADYLDGKITLDQAIDESKKKTKRYIKKQLTWLKNQYKPLEIEVDFTSPLATARKIKEVLKEKLWL